MGTQQHCLQVANRGWSAQIAEGAQPNQFGRGGTEAIVGHDQHWRIVARRDDAAEALHPRLQRGLVGVQIQDCSIAGA